MPAATVRVSRLVIEAVLYSAPLSAASSSSSDSEDGGMRSLGWSPSGLVSLVLVENVSMNGDKCPALIAP
jgi:hypothetical protein